MRQFLKALVIFSTLFSVRPLEAATLQLIHETTGTYNSAKDQNVQMKVSTGGFNVVIATSGVVSSSATTATGIPRFSQIKIVQVVTYTAAASSATTATTFVASNLSGPITPQSTSSRIFIVATGQIRASNVANGAEATLLRGTSNLAAANGMCFPVSAGVVTDGLDFPCTMTLMDSPSTTSSTTYAVGIRGQGGATATWTNQSTTSSLTLIEVNGL